MIEGSACGIYVGLPGSGKTLRTIEERALPALVEGLEVYSNTWINWTGKNLHYYRNEDFEELCPTLRNCVLIMDEIQRVMEPRQWEAESGNIRAFFQLHRHRHVDIYGTAQDISLIAKSALIVVDSWELVEKFEPAWWMKWIMKYIYKSDFIRISSTIMTYGQLKKISNGWEIDDVDELNDLGQSINCTKTNYKITELIHHELDETKEELYHYYCDKSAGRQGEKISKTSRIDDILIQYCPKHQEEVLSIKESAIYDTEFELDLPEKKITWQALIDCPSGYRKIPFKGALSSNQIASRGK